MSLRRSSEAGLTLIELVIAIVLMTMIAGALGAAFLTATTSSHETAGRVRGSNDAQVIAAFLTRDAQSAGGVDPLTGLTDQSLGVFTNAPSDPGNPCASIANPVVRFRWIDRSATGTSTYDAVYAISGTELVRTFCVDGGAPATAPLAHDVATAFARCTTGGATGPCGAPPLPDSVSVTITETNTQNAPTPYSYTLSATVRPQPQHALSTSNAAAVPLLALGEGNCTGTAQAAGLDLGGNANLTVYGGVAINATTSGSCPAVFLHGSYTYTAAGDPTNTSVGDPFANLPTPSGTCHGGSNPAPVGGVYQPSVYPQALPGGAVLAAGVFVLCGGIDASLTATSGTMLYVAQGAINITGGTMKVTAPSSGPYAGVAIWQAASDTSPLTVSGNAVMDLGIPPNGGGALYAPNAEVDLIGTANFTIQVLVAKVVFIQGNHTISVGTPPPSLPTITSPMSLPSGRVTVSYQPTQVRASGGSNVFTWSATLPPGLSINASTGVISGTPTSPGTFTAEVKVTDNLGDVYVKPYTVTILDLSTVTRTTPNTQDQGWSGTVTVTGTNFDSGAQVRFSGGGITVSGTTFASATTLQANVSIATNAATGSRDVTVTNGDGSSAISRNLFTVAPLPTITSVTLANHGTGTAGRIEQADTITVVFSSQMSVTSLCSRWSDDTSNQSLTGNNDVTVTLTDGPGATNDTIKVASATCTFNFGTLDLGSSAYVGGANLTFKGTGNNNKSTINWTESTHTLVIKLGQQAGTGTTAVVATSAPKYTVPAAVTDSNGGPVNNSPYQLPNGRQF